jgi:lipoprotein-anchoring transpeptidase ErfK/SrfK
VHKLAAVALIATLHHPAAVFRAPNVHTWSRQVLPLYTPLSHQRTALPVLRRRGRFLQVLLPGRPNGHVGWIAADKAKTWKTPWRVVVRTGSKRLFVLNNGRIVHSFPVVVGKSSTPTPTGRFYVEEALILRRGSMGSPDAYALSARSNVYQEFEGGPGQIAIHGTYGIGGTPGRAQSHGCIRATTRTLLWMIQRFGTGTPVDIRG